MTLGRPRLHLRETTSTNDRARDLAAAGAPHGTIVTTGAQREQAVELAHDQAEQERAAGRRAPGATVAPAPGRLHSGGHDGAVGRAARGKLARAVVGRRRLAQVQARTTERHSASSRTSSPGCSPSSAAASPPLIASASAPPASS